MKCRCDGCIRILLTVFAVVVWVMFPMEVLAEDSSCNITVEYRELRDLLKTGNPTLKQVFEEYEADLEVYQEMWDIMKFEQGNLEDKAEEAEDDGEENAQIYSSNAELLKNSARRIYRQMDNLKNEKNTRSMEASADSYTMMAQTVMNSYNQIQKSVEVQEKNVEALGAIYTETVKKQAIGSATQADAVSAQKNSTQAINSLESLKEEASKLKISLLTMLGLQGKANVIIAEIPEPELAVIDAIDLETDKQKAVGNSKDVQDVRHASAYSTVLINQRSRLTAEAEETALADIQEAYGTLMVKKINHQAALASYQSALLDYQSLQRKLQAGLLNNVDYLQGETNYLKKKAAKETASMNLVQAYESYCWEVEGIEE